jgi:hypothetical protein
MWELVKAVVMRGHNKRKRVQAREEKAKKRRRMEEEKR